MRMILIELRKMFGNIRIYLSAICIAAAYLLSMFAHMESSLHFSINEFLFDMYTDAYALFIYMLGIVGGGFFYCMEEKGGCLSYEVHRTSVARYAGAKTVSSYLGGFISTLIGYLLSVCAAMFILWFRYHDWNQVWIGGGYEYADILTNVFMLLFKSLYVGLLSVIAYLITTIYPDYFVGMVMPLLIHYVYIILTGWIIPLQVLDIRYIYDPGYGLFSSITVSFVYAAAFSICVCALICRYSIYFIQRRLEHS